MKTSILAVVLMTAVMAGCATKPQPVVTKIVSVPVIVDDRAFEIPEAPKPPTAQDFEGQNYRGKLAVLGDKIVVLYSHIEKLEEQINSIYKTMVEKAARVEQGNKK